MKRDFMAIKFGIASTLISLLLAFFAVLLLASPVSAQETYVLPQYENNSTTIAQAEDNSSQSAIGSGTPNIQKSLCAGANLDVNASCDTNSEDQDAGQAINSLVADIINLFSWVVGIVAVIMIIFGGFQYITSGGDSSKVGTAKNTILYALIGIVIVALSQTIVKFVLGRVIQ